MELCHYKFQTLFETLISHITINSDIKILNKRYKLGMDIGATLQPVVVLSHHVNFFLGSRKTNSLKIPGEDQLNILVILYHSSWYARLLPYTRNVFISTNFHPFCYLWYSKFDKCLRSLHCYVFYTIDIGITFIRVVFLHVAHFISLYLLWHTHGDRLGKYSTTQCLHDMSNHSW